MAVKATPWVEVNGTRLPCTREALEGGAVTAVQGFTIQWGRDSYIDAETTPASLTMWLADPTADIWATLISSNKAIGMKVRVIADLTDTVTGAALGSIIVYRGRIHTATATPGGTTQTNRVKWWKVEIKCSDRTADFGNSIINELVWASASMLVRANQIKKIGQDGGSEIDAVYFWPGYVNTPARPMEEKNVSGLQLLAEFYASMGNDSYAYDPHENVIRQAIRLEQKLDIYLREYYPGVVAPAVNPIVVDEVEYPALGVSGCDIPVNELAVSTSAEQAVNRLECTWRWDGDDWAKDWTFIRDYQNDGDSRRVYSWSTWIGHNETVNATLTNVVYKVMGEGSRPRHPNLATRASFEFTDFNAARWFLQTWENTRPVYIWGDSLITWLNFPYRNAPPVFAPIGGVTSFDAREGWSLDIRLQQFQHDYVGTGGATTWDSLARNGESMVWGTQHEPAAEGSLVFADGVSWHDLYHVPQNSTTRITNIERI